MSQDRIEFEMSVDEVRIAYAALCDQHIVDTDLRQAKNRITGRLMARLQSDAWLAEGSGTFDMEEEDARSFVELLGREPGAPKKLAGIIQGRIIFLESPAPEI
jgi:hypothetical protein